MEKSFEAFVKESESKLRHALVTRYGPEVGRDAASEAFAYAWEHWDRVSKMDNPVGYLYRVGQSRARRHRRPAPHLPAPPAGHEPEFEPGLPAAVASLTDKQRTVVLLIHSFGWLMTEVAEVLGVALTTVQKHEERGMAKLRKALEVAVDA